MWGVVEQLMFSINPAYDYQHGEYANGSAGERMALYRRCEKEGVGISVMKPYSGGQLLSAAGVAVRTGADAVSVHPVRAGTSPACSLCCPASAVSPTSGTRSASSTRRRRRATTPCSAPSRPGDAAGACVYCNHCAPCPAGLNIGLINKYYDLGGDRRFARGGPLREARGQGVRLHRLRSLRPPLPPSTSPSPSA